MKKYTRYLPSLFLIVIIICSISLAFTYTIALILGAVILALVFLAEFVFFMSTYKSELKIETPDGSNQPYHPSVLFFENGWNGWEYWMSYTPMPLGAAPYTDRWECPCVIVSHDGINWCYPSGKKFLDDLTEQEIENKDYYSDTHLVYDNENDCICLYYRLSKTAKRWTDITLYRKETYDGMNWSERKKVLDNDSMESKRPTSPAIIKEKKESVYKIWFVTEMMVGEKHDIYYAVSPDGVKINKIELVNFGDYKIDPWHIDCQFFDERYYLTVFSLDERVTLFESNNGVDFSFKKTMLLPSKRPGSFFRKGLYRSCLLKDNKSYKLYFSAKDGRRVSIGMMQGKSIDEMKVVSGNKKRDYKAFWLDMIEKYFLLGKRLLHFIHH